MKVFSRLLSFLGTLALISSTSIADNCEYGKQADGMLNMNILSCSDGTFLRGSDNVFRPAGVGSLPAAANSSVSNGRDLQNSQIAAANIDPLLGSIVPAGSVSGDSSTAPGADHSTPESSTSPPRSENASNEPLPPYQSNNRPHPQNPSFNFDMYGMKGLRKLSSCFATVFDWVAGQCLALTASHCLESVLASTALDVAQNQCEDDPPKADGEQVSMKFRMNSQFGAHQAEASVNRNYYDSGNGDIATLKFACPNRPKNIVPLCSTPAQHGESIKYAKGVGQPGLYSGQIHMHQTIQTPKGVGTAHSTAGTYDVRQHGPATQPGDSGGALIRTGENCLLAALSGGVKFDDGQSHSTYGTASAGRQFAPLRTFTDRVISRLRARPH